MRDIYLGISAGVGRGGGSTAKKVCRDSRWKRKRIRLADGLVIVFFLSPGPKILPRVFIFVRFLHRFVRHPLSGVLVCVLHSKSNRCGAIGSQNGLLSPVREWKIDFPCRSYRVT